MKRTQSSTQYSTNSKNGLRRNKHSDRSIVLELTLEPGENYTEKLEWNLYQYKEERYILPKPGKYNLSGICLHTGAITPDPITITAPYSSDLNRDLKVDVQDITTVAIAFSSKDGDPGWNPIADIDRNRSVNIIDVTIVARDYGKTI